MNKTKSIFSHSALLSRINNSFKSVSGNDQKNGISISDCLMSGVAIFSLKYKSLLKFEVDKAEEEYIKHNIKSLYGVAKIPCDTYLRERLDDTALLPIIRKSFVSLFSILQRSKTLENWKFLDNKFLVSLDATGFFSSNNVKCEHCCEKVHNEGKDNQITTYHHQMLVGSIVSPDIKQALPIEFEPIVKSDGFQKK